ncbi:SpoIIE family protein phosphatase [Pelagicoccus albus]|uniref:SpoIIE family protein phosphatase n=1 Tax=Pelagicoccus albus TaxID=415222 RepID=A0A7X1B6F1_9BACT|nr:SpoIIE family protein phosphatase [Pelagicoccus albus]MBC2606491.1 SpoIIE family protein phosphatase [Pelagicoccus albus]
MKTIKVDCSPLVAEWLAELRPELDADAVDATLPISGFVEKIDLVIVGNECGEPINLARTISEWNSAPISIFLIESLEYETLDHQLQYAPGVGKNILSCRLDKDSFAQALSTALHAIKQRSQISLDLSRNNVLFNQNLSSRWLLNRLLRELPEYIYFKDTKCRFLAVSDYLAKSTGLGSGSEAIGKTDYAIFDNDHALDAEKDEQNLIEGKVPFIDKEEYVTWEGNQMWVQSYKLPLMSPSGYPLGTFGISRDITQKKIMQDELVARHKQLNEEMDLARLLQKSLLNKDLPRFANSAGDPTMEFAVKHVPSTKLSGDFYNIRRTPQGHPAIFLADVMGHGASAAMITAMLYATLNEISYLADEPDRYMLEINNRLHSWLKDTGQFIFASGVYCVLDTESKKAHLCQNGGAHVMMAKQDSTVYLNSQNSPINSALGITPQDSFTSHSLDYQTQDEFLLFTDGIIEAMNPKGEAYTTENLDASMAKAAGSDPNQKLDTLYRDLQNFTDREHQEDDICMVLAKAF